MRVAIPGIGCGPVRRRQVGISPGIRARRAVNVEQEAETHRWRVRLDVAPLEGGAELAWPCAGFVIVRAVGPVRQSRRRKQFKLVRRYNLHMAGGGNPAGC
jgi:hypothetical protein